MCMKLPRIDLLRALVGTGAAQVALQAVAFVTGLLIVRFLSPSQYALYTIATAVASVSSILADSGIATSAMATAARQDYRRPETLGMCLASAVQNRRRLSVVVGTVLLPVAVILLYKNGATILESTALACALILLSLSSATTGIMEVAPKLHQQISLLQRNQLIAALQRLFLTSITLLLTPAALAVICANCAIQTLANFRSRRLAALTADMHAAASEVVSAEIRRSVKRVLPGAIYYSLSGQMIVWIAAIFANATNVAAVGALGRITMLTVIISSVASIVVIPRFARLSSTRSLLVRRFLEVQGALCFGTLLLVTVTNIGGNYILALLGTGYRGLNYELSAFMFAACIGVQQGITYSLASHRGHIMRPTLSIGLSIGSMILLLPLFDVTTLRGIISYSLLFNLAQYILWITFCFRTVLR